MTTFDHFKKIAWGAHSALPGVGGQIFFSQTRVFQMKGPCKNSRFYYQSSGRAPSGLCSLFGIIWGHYGDLEGHALFSSSYSCGIFQKLSFDMQHDYILTTLKKSHWGAHSAPPWALGVDANFFFTDWGIENEGCMQKIAFLHQNCGRAPPGLCSLFGVLWRSLQWPWRSYTNFKFIFL